MTEDEDLLSALEAFLEADAGEAEAPLRTFLKTFLASTLLVAEDGELAYVKTKSGQFFLAVFTDEAEVRSFAKAHRPMPMTGAEVVKLIARGDYSGVYLNPNTHRFELTAEDVHDLFEVDEA